MANKTTKKDFELFERHLKEWLDFHGLPDYRVDIRWEGDEGRASVFQAADLYDRIFVASLTKDWGDDEVTAYRINESAYHEALEILFWPIYSTLLKFISPEIARDMVHRIIRLFENRVFPVLIENQKK